ncbi:DUF7601 domain-containing protein [Pseudoramibacter alactolyticus]
MKQAMATMKKSRVLAMLALALVLAAFTAIPAWAADAITSQKVPVKITADDNVPVNATIAFNVQNGAAGTFDGQPTIAGVTGGVAVADVALTGKGTQSKDATMTFDASKFSAPGIYHYTIAQKDPGIDGLTVDTAARDLYIYVENDTSGMKVVAAVYYKSHSTTKNESFENTYNTNDLKIEKKVTGSQGDKKKDFNFEVTVNGATGETYTLIKSGDSANPVVLTSGTKYTFTLKHDENVVVYGLSANDKVTYKETDENQDGYTTTYSQASHENVSFTEDAAGTVTNDRDVTPPTGIFYNPITYIVLIAAAALFGFVMLRRRSVREDD